MLVLPDVVFTPIVEDDGQLVSDTEPTDATRPTVPAFAWTPTVARVLALLFWLGVCCLILGIFGLRSFSNRGHAQRLVDRALVWPFPFVRGLVRQKRAERFAAFARHGEQIQLRLHLCDAFGLDVHHLLQVVELRIELLKRQPRRVSHRCPRVML